MWKSAACHQTPLSICSVNSLCPFNAGVYDVEAMTREFTVKLLSASELERGDGRSTESGQVHSTDRCPDVDEHEILLHSSMHKKIFGYEMRSAGIAAPWKRGVVRVWIRGGKPVYLRYRSKGLVGLDQFTAVIHDRTKERIMNDLRTAPQVSGGTEGFCRGGHQRLARTLHYLQHPKDEVRCAYKLALVGVVLSIISFAHLVLQIAGALKD